MRCPKRGEVFKLEMADTEYMSLMDKAGDMVRCISGETKKQTSVGSRHVAHIFTAEQSQKKMLSFFEAPKMKEEA